MIAGPGLTRSSLSLSSGDGPEARGEMINILMPLQQLQI